MAIFTPLLCCFIPRRVPIRQQPWGKEVMLNERHEAFASYTMPQQLTLVKRFAEIRVMIVNLCGRNVT